MVFCLRGLGIVLMRSVSLARSNNHTSQSKRYLFNSPCGSIRLALSLAGSLQLQTPKIKSGLFLKNRLFFGFWYFGGLLCGMVSGPPVAPGNYTQQWPLQAPIPSSMLETKIGPIS